MPLQYGCPERSTLEDSGYSMMDKSTTQSWCKTTDKRCFEQDTYQTPAGDVTTNVRPRRAPLAARRSRAPSPAQPSPAQPSPRTNRQRRPRDAPRSRCLWCLHGVRSWARTGFSATPTRGSRSCPTVNARHIGRSRTRSASRWTVRRWSLMGARPRRRGSRGAPTSATARASRGARPPKGGASSSRAQTTSTSRTWSARAGVTAPPPQKWGLRQRRPSQRASANHIGTTRRARAVRRKTATCPS